jgi:hypothetical protein
MFLNLNIVDDKINIANYYQVHKIVSSRIPSPPPGERVRVRGEYFTSLMATWYKDANLLQSKAKAGV